MFDKISALSNDTTQMLQEAAKQLAESGRLHQLFDLRLMQRRQELGMSPSHDSSLDELDESLRAQLEQAYLDACSEVGQLFLEAGQIREAWTYLRPLGDKSIVRRWLERVVPDEDSAENLIALALHEGIDPERGFAWLLAQRGTCNAITELEGVCGNLPHKDQIACSTVLVRHVHQELLSNLQGHLERLKPDAPQSNSISTLIADHPQLLEEGGYHIDTSHLATTVRFARLLTEPSLLSLAIELADYGSKLAKDLQYPDNPPFEETYPAHLLLFQATLGQNVEQAIEFFSRHADSIDINEFGTSAVETYLILLNRIGRAGQALEEYPKLVPPDQTLSPYAPTLLHLAQESNAWDKYLDICQKRDDLVGFAAGYVVKQSS